MKWRTVLCTALFLCGTVLLSACGGGEMPAPAEPPASSEVPAPSQPEEVPAPSESASSSEPEPLPEPEPPKPWDGMVVPTGCKAEWSEQQGKIVLTHYEYKDGVNLHLPTGRAYSIGSNCFKNDWKLKSVVIPEDVIEIRQSAFQESGLLQVTVPMNVRVLGNDVFADCHYLTQAEIEGTEKTGERVFARCESLQKVKLGYGVVRIEEGAFEHTGLVEIELPTTLGQIDKLAFSYCKLKEIIYDGDWEAKRSELENNKNIGKENDLLLAAKQK